MERVVIHFAPTDDSRICYDFERKCYYIIVGRKKPRAEAEAACRKWVKDVTGQDCEFVDAWNLEK